MTTTVGLVLFDEVDLLDVGGPYEVLLTANRLSERQGAPPPFEVLTLAADDEPLRAYGGLRLVPHTTFAAAPDLDVLVVPGAIAIEEVLAPVGATIREVAARTPVVTSVCTGAFVLGALGLLDGHRWTTHWEDIDGLTARLEPAASAGANRDVRVVDDGPVVTAGGLLCGVDLGLHLVARFAGRDLAVATARQIDYAWMPTGD
jgi:transcriptional regulator GlxA family with amidase domain